MKFNTILIVAFLLIALSITMGSFIAVGMTDEILQEALGNDSTAFAVELKNIIWLTGLSTLILVALIEAFISHALSRPCKKLTEAVEKVSKGQLDVQIEKSWIAEVNQLAEALDRVMTSMKLAIKRTAPELEKQLEEREDLLLKLQQSKDKYRQLLEKTKEKPAAKAGGKKAKKTPGKKSGKSKPV